MTRDDFQTRLHTALSAYVTAQNRATVVMNARLDVLFKDARTCRIPEAEISEITLAELAQADQRLAAMKQRFGDTPMKQLEELRI